MNQPPRDKKGLLYWIILLGIVYSMWHSSKRDLAWWDAQDRAAVDKVIQDVRAEQR